MSNGVLFPQFLQQIRKMDSISVSGLHGKVSITGAIRRASVRGC